MFRSGFLLSMLRFNILSNYSRMVVGLIGFIDCIVCTVLGVRSPLLAGWRRRLTRTTALYHAGTKVTKHQDNGYIIEMRLTTQLNLSLYIFFTLTSWFMKVETCWIIWGYSSDARWRHPNDGSLTAVRQVWHVLVPSYRKQSQRQTVGNGYVENGDLKN